MPDPSEGDLALGEFGKFGAPMLSGATGEQGFPDHFVKESAWAEVFRGGKFFERARQALTYRRWPLRWSCYHTLPESSVTAF